MYNMYYKWFNQLVKNKNIFNKNLKLFFEICTQHEYTKQTK